jgi:outer membrane protein OmpA-like peptidoglycan-associated protein
MIGSNKTSSVLGRFLLWSLSAFIGVGLIACSKPYVVLLDNDDGTIGKVKVTTNEGTTVLEKPREGAVIGGEAGKTFTVSEDQINKDFGSAISSSPKKPVSFYLYFGEGSAKLTHSSAADIPKIIEEIGKRPVPDISVIGHTDTVADEQYNERLSLKRAKSVASLLDNVKLDVVKVIVECHGEKNLLVPTPDDTDEPRNRSVEVTVR